MQTDRLSSLNHLFFHHVEQFRSDRLLTWQKPDGLEVYSTERFVREVLALSRFLSAGGLEGDRVGIFCENRPGWHIADFATLLARQVVVPVYPTLAPGQIQYLLRHSGCRVVVIGGQKQWEVLAPLLADLPQSRCVISLDELAAAHTSLPRIVSETPEWSPADREEIRARALSVDPQSLATIVYTSGTTGVPKGVMLSHANFTFDLSECLKRILSQTASQALSVLPLPHVFERLLCYGYSYRGVPIAYGDPHDLKTLAKIHRPQVMGCVPRILEKIREAVQAQIGAMPAWRQAAARALLNAGYRRARGRMTGERTGPGTAVLARLAGFLVYPRIHRQLGGLEYLICGGAWLDPELELFFRAAGFELLQGYGMTDTSPVIALNPYAREKLGSVGPPLEGVQVRLAEDGEILTRGPHVMLGYYNDPEATAQTFRDGWLATGDLGRIDEQGYLSITGRQKEILVLSNGKNVSCAPVEHALESSRLVERAFVVGEGRKFASALIVPDRENLRRLAAVRGMPAGGEEQWLASPAVIAVFREEITRCQSHLSPFEQVKRFSFLHPDALLDPELITPTQKVPRAVLEQKYTPWIRQMYLREEPLVIPRSVPEKVPAAQA